jgi:hypothetical protein
MAITQWRSAPLAYSASGSDPFGSGIALAGFAASIVTTSGAISGDHSAGLSRTLASGSVGKTKAPPPGQALLFFSLFRRMLGDAGLGRGMILPVVAIAIQEFLREIRVVVIAILICGRW